VFKKYSQMKREALFKLNGQANEQVMGFDQRGSTDGVLAQF